MMLLYENIRSKFQSTHPGWGETVHPTALPLYVPGFQSTHPGWGETERQRRKRKKNKEFQSTHPGWGETKDADYVIDNNPISIHSPRVG